jgi:hypothetical protein
MATETDLPTLQKLCWFIAEQWKAELAYSRAQYRVSYYRKLKAKLEASKKTSEKWNDHIELAKKIESVRLTSLKKQEQLMNTKKRFRSSINLACKKLKATQVFKDGKVVGIRIAKELKPYFQEVNADQVAEYADQYEANRALTNVLSRQ